MKVKPLRHHGLIPSYVYLSRSSSLSICYLSASAPADRLHAGPLTDIGQMAQLTAKPARPCKIASLLPPPSGPSRPPSPRLHFRCWDQTLDPISGWCNESVTLWLRRRGFGLLPAPITREICCTERSLTQPTEFVQMPHYWDQLKPYLCSLALMQKPVTRTHRQSVVTHPLAASRFVCLLVGCLTSQQHASVSQGRICSDNLTCCHTEIEVADQTFYLTQSQYTDTGPTSPSADPITPGAWQGSHWNANF